MNKEAYLAGYQDKQAAAAGASYIPALDKYNLPRPTDEEPTKLDNINRPEQTGAANNEGADGKLTKSQVDAEQNPTIHKELKRMLVDSERQRVHHIPAIIAERGGRGPQNSVTLASNINSNSVTPPENPKPPDNHIVRTVHDIY